MGESREVWFCFREAGGQPGKPWTYGFRRLIVLGNFEAKPIEKTVEAQLGVYEAGKFYDQDLNHLPEWDGLIETS